MKVLVAIDLSSLTEPLAQAAAKLAGMSGATLTLLHIVKGTRLPDIEELENPEDIEYRREQLEALAGRLRSTGAQVEVSVKVTVDLPHQIVLQEAAGLGADMIVVGSHGRSRAFELFIGSCTMGVIREANVPVLVVNGATSVSGPG